MIVYNRKLDACEIQTINRYLGAKYGVVFSNGKHRYSGPATFMAGGSVTLSSHITGTAYQWLKDGQLSVQLPHKIIQQVLPEITR